MLLYQHDAAAGNLWKVVPWKNQQDIVEQAALAYDLAAGSVDLV